MALTLMELSERIGWWSWMEARSFEVMGGWVQAEPLAAAKVHFHSHSMRLGAHARMLGSLLPEIAGTDPTGFIAPVNGAAVEFMAQAEQLSTTAERLGIAYALMSSRKIVAYRQYLAGASPVAEMPAIRVVASILADEEKDLSIGITAWESIRRDAQAAGEAIAAISRFEEIIRGADPFALASP